MTLTLGKLRSEKAQKDTKETDRRIDRERCKDGLRRLIKDRFRRPAQNMENQRQHGFESKQRRYSLDEILDMEITEKILNGWMFQIA